MSTRRRRRRGGGGGISISHPSEQEGDSTSTDSSDASSPSGQSSALSEEQFLSASNDLLDRVESAIAKLKDCNDGLEVTRHPPSASVDDHGISDLLESLEGEEGVDEERDMPQRHGGQLSIRVLSSEDLYWGGGTYWLTILPDDPDGASSNDGGRGNGGVVALRSPLSGSFSYVYDVSSGEWVGSEDGHSLLGMFTRDWIRQCKGVPDF